MVDTRRATQETPRFAIELVGFGVVGFTCSIREEEGGGGAARRTNDDMWAAHSPDDCVTTCGTVVCVVTKGGCGPQLNKREGGGARRRG